MRQAWTDLDATNGTTEMELKTGAIAASRAVQFVSTSTRQATTTRANCINDLLRTVSS